jgi:seryl-tRNA synthetase
MRWAETQYPSWRPSRPFRSSPASTRSSTQKEGDRVIHSNENGNRALSRTIELATGNLQDALESEAETDAIQHNQTQAQISELQEALRQLSEQIEARDRQLAVLLTDLSKIRKAKTRKRLQEQSNAVIAAIVALQTMYCRFLVCTLTYNRHAWLTDSST